MIHSRQLRQLVTPTTPLASVYIGATSTLGDRSETRQSHIAEALARDGADQATVDTVTTLVRDLPAEPTAYAVFACQGQVQAVHRLAEGPLADLASYGTPARIGPLLSWLQRHPAYVLVEPTPTGAELTSVPLGGLRGRRRHVTGIEEHVPRPRSGLSWRPPRPVPWVHHASRVVAAIAEELDRVAARMVLIAGDVRATHLVSEGLRNVGRAAVVRFLPARRGSEGLSGHLDVAVTTALDGYAASRAGEVLTWFRRARGTSAAVQGAAATVQALAAGTARTLLIVDDPAMTRQAWFSAGELCSITVGSRRPGDLCRGRLIDVVIRAALVSGVAVHVVEASAAGDIGGGMAALTTAAIRNVS